MFRRHTPARLLIAVIAMWGLAAFPLSPDAQAAGSPTQRTTLQAGDLQGGGGSDLPSGARISGVQVAGDPDEYTQTGGTSPKPTPGGSSTTIYSLLMGYLRSWLLLMHGVIFR